MPGRQELVALCGRSQQLTSETCELRVAGTHAELRGISEHLLHWSVSVHVGAAQSCAVAATQGKPSLRELRSPTKNHDK